MKIGVNIDIPYSQASEVDKKRMQYEVARVLADEIVSKGLINLNIRYKYIDGYPTCNITAEIEVN